MKLLTKLLTAVIFAAVLLGAALLFRIRLTAPGPSPSPVPTATAVPTLIPCKLSGHDAYNDYQPQPCDPAEPEFDRAMRKLDGSWDGPDLSIDYSPFH